MPNTDYSHTTRAKRLAGKQNALFKRMNPNSAKGECYVDPISIKLGGGCCDSATAPEPVFTRTVFTSGSGSWTAPSGVTSVTYLVVGGGGGGGGGESTGAGGGGGGGSVKTGTLSVTPGSTYSYTVGNGGMGGDASGTTPIGRNGIPGDNSIFASITANGGGFGHNRQGTNGSGLVGAGGAAQSGNTATTGGSGGNVRDSTRPAPNYFQGAGGGGGGAGGNGETSLPIFREDTTGQDCDNIRGGLGGPGVISDLKDGTNITYGAGGRGADEGQDFFITGNNNNVLTGASGEANTGNGGGGGASGRGGGVSKGAGGAGGSGIVVLTYGV